MDVLLQHDFPVHALDEEWRALLANQARILEAILTRIADTVATRPQHERAQQLCDLLTTAEPCLTTVAQQHIAIEQTHAVFQAPDACARVWPAETARRVHLMAEMNAIFHANVTAARPYLQDVRQRIKHLTTGEEACIS